MINHAITIQNAVNNIKNQIGPIDEDNLVTILYFLSAPQFKEQITAALDTCKATNPNIKIHGEDILDIIRQLASDQSNQEDQQISGINAKERPFPKKGKDKEKIPSRNKSRGQGNTSTTKEWQKQWLTPDNPCFYCLRVGHWAHECKLRARAQDFRNKHQKSNDGATVAAIGSIPLLENSEAMPDSGATHSVVGDVSLFTRLSPTNMTLTVASRDKFHVGAIRDIVLNTRNGPLLIKDVLYFFKMTYSIFIKTAILFPLLKHNFRWFISVSPPPPTYIQKMNPDIKPITGQQPPPINMSTRPTIENIVHDTSLLWHRRLSHLSLQNISPLKTFNAAEGILKGKIESKSICQSCALAKSQHAAIRSPTRNLIAAPGDVVCADLIGLISKSIENKKYMLIVQDIFSRLVAAIPLHDKTEAKVQLKTWIVRFNNHTPYKLRQLRTDNGSKLKNQFLDDFCSQQGIIREFSAPYKHHQNGQIERTNQTLSKMARTSLIGANLPPALWTFAFKHAEWIFNRVLHSEEQKTPYELMTGKKPSFHLLRVFGAKSYIHNHHHRKDMNIRATIGYHLGITPESKAWSFWVPGHDKVVRSASVKFDENTFFPGSPKPGAILSTIQVTNLTDNSMVEEINRQDAVTTSLNTSHDMASTTPTSYKDAINLKEADRLQEAISQELESIKVEKVFKTISLSQVLKSTKRENLLSTKWVFVKKLTPLRFKARLVARVFRKIQGINFDETFAPTPTFATLRLLLAISCKHRWPLKTFDLKVAFLHSYIDMLVYVWPPKGLETDQNTILQLNKALYGTKQAARCWWLHLTAILTSIGFTANAEDLSSYSYKGELGSALLWIHVDDGPLTASSDKLLSHLMLQLDSKLNFKWDDDISSLVGITISSVNGGYLLSQPDLITKVVGMSTTLTTATSPLPHNCNLVSNTGSTMDIEYLRRIGVLLYISQVSRPDITFAVNYLARFSMGTDVSHWHALEHLLSYLR
ncbi:hypothetical protein O181_064690 [Austropuccinia psidii MF-1]|uniref:Integrase catalytic domain-containing protein n=1 Tax=Austropuccinia psidii MF-1 TaxID=1389203 RepID=A0A9Q3ETM4_9BASI|nr:hypothetical protein [Austropuccinia psidii MF-1]